LMSVVGLLDQHPNPTAQQIEEGISGNLCRCTGYASIRRAVHRAVELSSTPSPLRGEGRGAGREPNTPSPLRGEGRGAGREPNTPSPLRGEGRGAGRKPA
jgi:hypothetical protein